VDSVHQMCTVTNYQTGELCKTTVPSSYYMLMKFWT
jgi:hypothetical protein